MAWRFDKQIIRGEISNVVRGSVTGRIWLVGVAEPMALELVGDCAPDLAGCTLTFENPAPEPFSNEHRPFQVQDGYVGDITAAQKGREFDLPMEEALEMIRKGGSPSSHWVNRLYLEWFSDGNGRVVIQTAQYHLTISEPAWTLSEEEYRASREASSEAFATGMAIDPEDVFARDDDGEGEEWKRCDDAPCADDDFLFDPMDNAAWMPVREILVKYGFTPLRSAEVSDKHLYERLWELIHALATRRIYLSYTGHLDDRALYEWLDEFLDEPNADCPLEAEINMRVDVSNGSTGSDEGLQVWLRFHATEQDRADWMERFPEDLMPPREQPVSDRDSRLPK